MNWRVHITLDFENREGEAHFKGSNLLVQEVSSQLAAGLDASEDLSQTPELTAEGLQAAQSHGTEIALRVRSNALADSEARNGASPDVLISWAEKELERLLDWVGAAESRLALVLPLATAMLGALALLIPDSITNWMDFYGVLAGVAALFLFLSLGFAAMASFPRTTGPKDSNIYFGSVAARDLESYRAEFKDLETDRYLSDLITQCHRNAQIAEKKYFWMKWSMAALFVAAIPWVLAVIFLYAAGSKG